MSNTIDTVEDRIQNAILTAIDNIAAPKMELAIRSINASSGRDVTSVSANSGRREHVGINGSFENASGNNDTPGVSNVNDETRHNILDKVSELLVPETHFDRQPHTHHNMYEVFKLYIITYYQTILFSFISTILYGCLFVISYPSQQLWFRLCIIFIIDSYIDITVHNYTLKSCYLS